MPSPTDKIIGLVLLSFGVLGTALSIFYESTILAFVGLALTFWGCLFLLVLKGKYIKSEVMDYMSISSLYSINQIVADLDLEGKAFYVPVPKESYLPYHIGTKNEFVYIPKTNLEIETAIDQAFTRRPEGLRLTPPGLGLADVAEKKSIMKFYDLNLDSLTEVLPPIMTHDLELCNNFKISLAGEKVHAEIEKPVCEELCREASKMQHLCPHVGCPLSSSIACILTRVTNRPIIMESCTLTGNTIRTTYRII